MIEVGEYVRTKKGKIFKYGKGRAYLGKDNAILKHSFNLIDLIEVGDFINGERILDITGDYIHTNEKDHNRFYLAKHIKTILTKEQYQANCYTVEREKDERNWN